jgi:hypothetical protein
MKTFDARFASPFRVDWLVPMDAVSQDDLARAVAEKAEVLLRGAEFVDLQRDTATSDVEVRVWIEAACGPACVSVTWEPGIARYGFYLLDEGLQERLGCIVFEDVPCVDGPASEAQADLVLNAALGALRAAQIRGEEPDGWVDAFQSAEKAFRVPIAEGPKPDLGIDP